MLVNEIWTQACPTPNPCSVSCVVLPGAFSFSYPESGRLMAICHLADSA